MNSTGSKGGKDAVSGADAPKARRAAFRRQLDGFHGPSGIIVLGLDGILRPSVGPFADQPQELTGGIIGKRIDRPDRSRRVVFDLFPKRMFKRLSMDLAGQDP